MVIALFDRLAEADQAVKRLFATPGAGAISLIVRETPARRWLHHPARADRGAIAGGPLECLSALMLGRRPVRREALGSVFMVGSLARRLRRADATLSGMLQAAGLDERAAQGYEGGVRRGRVLLAVQAGETARETVSLLNELDAARVDVARPDG